MVRKGLAAVVVFCDIMLIANMLFDNSVWSEPARATASVTSPHDAIATFAFFAIHAVVAIRAVWREFDQ